MLLKREPLKGGNAVLYEEVHSKKSILGKELSGALKMVSKSMPA